MSISDCVLILQGYWILTFQTPQVSPLYSKTFSCLLMHWLLWIQLERPKCFIKAGVNSTGQQAVCNFTVTAIGISTPSSVALAFHAGPTASTGTSFPILALLHEFCSAMKILVSSAWSLLSQMLQRWIEVLDILRSLSYSVCIGGRNFEEMKCILCFVVDAGNLALPTSVQWLPYLNFTLLIPGSQGKPIDFFRR